jgi:hypothetical protein
MVHTRQSDQPLQEIEDGKPQALASIRGPALRRLRLGGKRAARLLDSSLQPARRSPDGASGSDRAGGHQGTSGRERRAGQGPDLVLGPARRRAADDAAPGAAPSRERSRRSPCALPVRAERTHRSRARPRRRTPGGGDLSGQTLPALAHRAGGAAAGRVPSPDAAGGARCRRHPDAVWRGAAPDGPRAPGGNARLRGPRRAPASGRRGGAQPASGAGRC